MADIIEAMQPYRQLKWYNRALTHGQQPRQSIPSDSNDIARIATTTRFRLDSALEIAAAAAPAQHQCAAITTSPNAMTLKVYDYQGILDGVTVQALTR
ncbi:MAG: hypothetical protein ACK4IT_04880 [Thioalkalivibrionaceae bacterium]